MQPQKLNKGLFITFEGGDGAGKSTLIPKVHAYLEGKKYPVVTTRAPGGTRTGKQIREILLSQDKTLSKRCELLLFLADRAQHVDELIEPALRAQQIVLCDRFNDSTIAYQGCARELDTEVVRALAAFACKGLQPDLTLYLDLDPKIGLARTAASRSSQDRIESEEISFHEKIRQAFHQIAEKEPTRFLILDADRSPEDVYTQAIEKIDALLTTHRQ